MKYFTRPTIIVYLVFFIALAGAWYKLDKTSDQLRADAIVFCDLRNDAVVSQNVVANNFRDFMLSQARRIEEIDSLDKKEELRLDKEYAEYYRTYASRVEPAELVDCNEVLEKHSSAKIERSKGAHKASRRGGREDRLRSAKP